MRGWIILAATLALAACDSGGVPPPGQEPLRASSPQVSANQVELRADGLAAGTDAFYYAAGQNEVVAAVQRTLGLTADVSTNEECGAGPVDAARFGEDLILNFQDGSLVGWFVSGARDDIAVAGDVQVGTARAEAQEAKGFAPIADSTLGEEFALGDKVGGMIEGDAVSVLYSGTQCFFR